MLKTGARGCTRQVGRIAFKVTKSEVGYLKLSDGAIIYIRVTITDLKEGELKPTGPDFGIGFQISVAIHEIRIPQTGRCVVVMVEKTPDCLLPITLWAESP